MAVLLSSRGSGDWLLCADWLVRCQILLRDHRAALPTATISDLNHALRDGVLICLLVNRLRPKSIDPKDFSQRPQMSQFLCIKNIKVFLQACRNYFAMSDIDLFVPSDLFDGSGMQKVIASLSLLSQTPVARSSNIEPFVVDDGGSSSSAYINMSDLDDHYSDEEEYYTILADMQDEEDDVYGDLIAIKDRPRIAFPFMPDISATKSHRDLCVNELVTTEENYVRCLDMITANFMTPLKRIIPLNNFDKIFANIERLHEVHGQFYEELLMATNKESGRTIADCFITIKEKFLIYGEYCSNLLTAQELLDHVCNTMPPVQKRVTELQEEQINISGGRCNFKLRDLLTVPMQRVLKYHLLLKELIKHTDSYDQEKKSLEKALEETQDLSLFVNEVKRDNEMLHSLSMVQKSIQNLPLPSDVNLNNYGRLLLDGEVKVKFEKTNATRHVFVLDQLVIICKTRGDVHDYCHSFTPGKCDLDENLVKDWTNVCFSLTDRHTKENYMFGAKKEEVLKKWMDAIKMAQNNTMPQHAQNSLHHFTMATFNETTICDVCRKLLRGTFFQGYRCTKTNMAVHKECLSKAKDVRGPPSIPPKLQGRQFSKSQSFSDKASSPSQMRKGNKMYATCNYDGIPPPPFNRTPLTFEKGSAIDVYPNDGDFCEGHLNGREGFFPRKFVQRRPLQSAARYEEVNTSTSGVTLAPSTAGAGNANVTIDNNIRSCPWFVGSMERGGAVSCLQNLPDNVFLVRGSAGEARYALSLKYDGSTKHIRIQHSDDGSYYLASCHMFPTIPALIDYYQKNTLEKIFPEVKTSLKIPYKDALTRPRAPVIGYCIAQYDYEATSTNQISLREGDGIAVVSKVGEATGWWKGNNNGKVGYFPYAYVKEIDS